MKCSQNFIDLFLEFHPDNDFYRSSSSQLHKLEEYYKNKKEHNVRVHYTDIRLSKYVEQTKLLKYYMEIYWLIETSINNTYCRSYDNLKHWINNFDYTIDEKTIQLLTENKKICISNIWKEFNSYSKLTKQLNNCEIKNELIKYMKNVMLNNIKFDLLTWDNIKIVRDLYNEFYKIDKTLDYTNVELLIKKNKKKLEIIQHIIILFMSKFMDLYLLARMFRKFNKSFEDQNFNKNIVVYSGRTHTMTYLRFLTLIEFEKIDEWHGKINCFENVDHFSFDRKTELS